VSPIERVRVEPHGGSRIFVVDGTDVPAAEYAALLQAGAARVAREPPGSVLLATVVTRARFGSGAADHIKAYSAAIKPHVKASAVVGLSPLQRVIFQTLRPFMHSTVRDFPTLAEARVWLLGFEKPAA
jgi:hypothetical protein